MKRALFAAVAASLVGVVVLPPTVAAQTSELIPRKMIFGNPSRLMPKVSPDGNSLAWIAPRDGVLNVWVAPIGAIDKAKPVTNERPRPVYEYWWSPDGKRILYRQDRGGDENWVLYGVDIATGTQTAYTEPEKVTVELIAASPKVPGSILIGLNNRVPAIPRRLPVGPGQRQAGSDPAERSLGRIRSRLGPQSALRLAPDPCRGSGRRSHRTRRQNSGLRRNRRRRRLHHRT